MVDTTIENRIEMLKFRLSEFLSYHDIVRGQTKLDRTIVDVFPEVQQWEILHQKPTEKGHFFIHFSQDTGIHATVDPVHGFEYSSFKYVRFDEKAQGALRQQVLKAMHDLLEKTDSILSDGRVVMTLSEAELFEIAAGRKGTAQDQLRVQQFLKNRLGKE